MSETFVYKDSVTDFYRFAYLHPESMAHDEWVDDSNMHDVSLNSDTIVGVTRNETIPIVSQDTSP